MTWNTPVANRLSHRPESHATAQLRTRTEFPANEVCSIIQKQHRMLANDSPPAGMFPAMISSTIF